MRLRRPFSTGIINHGHIGPRDVQAKDIASAAWHKSSFSTYNGNCVEVARLGGDVFGVRDTKDQERGPVLAFASCEWGVFVEAVKAGRFDYI